MDTLIESADDLEQYFFELHRKNQKKPKTVYVSSKVRKEVLLSTEQGKITVEGRVYRFVFNSIGGGVWTACLGPL